MEIKVTDINLEKFLEKFTFVGDPNPGEKYCLPLETFLDLAAKLKLSVDLQGIKTILTIGKR